MGVLFDIQTEYESPSETEKQKTFKDFAAEDIHGVFLDLDEFAEKRDIRIGEETFRGVSTVTEALGFQARQEKTFCSRERTTARACSNASLPSTAT